MLEQAWQLTIVKPNRRKQDSEEKTQLNDKSQTQPTQSLKLSGALKLSKLQLRKGGQSSFVNESRQL